MVAHQGWADLAGTGIMLLFPFYTIQLIRNGLTNRPRKSGDAKIEAGKSALRDIVDTIQAFAARSSYLRLFFISVGYMLRCCCSAPRRSKAWGSSRTGS